jgi:hypothetical protein
MKLIGFAVILVAALAVGGLFGFNLDGSARVEGAPVQAAANVPADVAAADAPSLKVEAPVSNMVGMVGVLQNVAADQLMLETNEGMAFVAIDALAGLENGAAAIDALKVGDKLALWTQNVDGQLVVRKVVVVPQTPERMHYLGLVTSVAPDRVDVVGQQGETTSFRTDATVQWMPDVSRAPQIGDTVTVVAKPDPLGDGWLAVAIVTR